MLDPFAWASASHQMAPGVPVPSPFPPHAVHGLRQAPEVLQAAGRPPVRPGHADPPWSPFAAAPGGPPEAGWPATPRAGRTGPVGPPNGQHVGAAQTPVSRSSSPIFVAPDMPEPCGFLSGSTVLQALVPRPFAELRASFLAQLECLYDECIPLDEVSQLDLEMTLLLPLTSRRGILSILADQNTWPPNYAQRVMLGGRRHYWHARDGHQRFRLLFDWDGNQRHRIPLDRAGKEMPNLMNVLGADGLTVAVDLDGLEPAQGQLQTADIQRVRHYLWTQGIKPLDAVDLHDVDCELVAHFVVHSSQIIMVPIAAYCRMSDSSFEVAVVDREMFFHSMDEIPPERGPITMEQPHGRDGRRQSRYRLVREPCWPPPPPGSFVTGGLHSLPARRGVQLAPLDIATASRQRRPGGRMDERTAILIAQEAAANSKNGRQPSPKLSATQASGYSPLPHGDGVSHITPKRRQPDTVTTGRGEKAAKKVAPAELFTVSPIMMAKDVLPPDMLKGGLKPTLHVPPVPGKAARTPPPPYSPTDPMKSMALAAPPAVVSPANTAINIVLAKDNPGAAGHTLPVRPTPAPTPVINIPTGTKPKVRNQPKHKEVRLTERMTLHYQEAEQQLNAAVIESPAVPNGEDAEVRHILNYFYPGSSFRQSGQTPPSCSSPAPTGNFSAPSASTQGGSQTPSLSEGSMFSTLPSNTSELLASSSGKGTPTDTEDLSCTSDGQTGAQPMQTDKPAAAGTAAPPDGAEGELEVVLVGDELQPEAELVEVLDAKGEPSKEGGSCWKKKRSFKFSSKRISELKLMITKKLKRK